MSPLEERIGYKFRNPLLLAEALTHPSVGHESQRKHFDNQRLEFLGDAVLQLVITEHLYGYFTAEAEGKLTKLRARLVSREALARSPGIAGVPYQFSRYSGPPTCSFVGRLSGSVATNPAPELAGQIVPAGGTPRADARVSGLQGPRFSRLWPVDVLPGRRESSGDIQRHRAWNEYTSKRKF